MASLVVSGEVLGVNIEHRHLLVVRLTGTDRGQKQSIPLVDVDRVVIIGRPSISMAVFQKLMYMAIPVYFITSHGRWIGTLAPDKNMQASRRIIQYQKQQDRALALEIAKEIVKTKLLNSRRVLQRLSSTREESDIDEQINVSADLMKLVNRIKIVNSLDELRGIEGMGAAVYFSRLGKFFPKNVPFNGRSRRPPRDPANALLSWTYTIVLGELEAMVRTHGLDPCIGFLHELSHGSPSLALDLLEPFRAPLCDLLVLNILNHNILTDESFEFHSNDGGFYLKEECRKEFFQAYENTMNRKFKVAGSDIHSSFRQVMESQISAILFAIEGKGSGKFFRMP
ncbi:MAG: CRISPR-associated protein Cas1 [uncultured bacterium]|nr:MAG: CRISPR-associated protein Cas1 [uncultured bacterium]